uniref:Uncharacterized protein n=1 Tax=Panagrellus redivivus TaxID=6233 RepID=A0A7E4ZVI4_PANRE
MSGPDEMEYYSLGFKELQVRFLSLRFALLMIITNDITKERFVYKLLTADKLPTGTFSFYVYGAGFVHECRTVYNTFFTN